MGKDFKTQLGTLMESEKAAEQATVKAAAKKTTPAKTKSPAKKNDTQPDTDNTPIGYRLVAEPKSKRLNLLIRPSIYAALQDKAAEQGTSVNDLINNILQGAL